MVGIQERDAHPEGISDLSGLPQSTALLNKRSLRKRSLMYPLEVTVEHPHRENIALYQRLLAETNVTKDQVRHAMLMELLAAAMAMDKLRPPSCSQGY